MNFIQNDSSTQLTKALFLDRDGVIVNYIPYLSHPTQVKIPQKAGEALKKWQDAGYLLIVITNQSGVGRGYFSMDMVNSIHNYIIEKYSFFGVTFKEFLICPHIPSDQCMCRKPSPKMIFQAAQKYSIDLSHSFLIGDAPSDIECAISAGCSAILVLTGRGVLTAKMLSGDRQELVSVFNSLIETVEIIRI
ncbi:HAD-IIIA family hydrolase [Pseudanabaena sp. BC1403]|uniref:D-glycero-alpha-D-manno-heptose-1,7-bisphosphate 7-phosphatase n=1 Tax=Pseudanabaena sp. BC1403 TaxID=2043171 RepID=UPI000CD825DE|nr:HAD family hydrolase [Pseudanabaena sp. BC1403]